MERAIKKVLIGLLGLVLVGGYLCSQYWYQPPGIISDLMNPVGKNQTVTWEQGPTEPRLAGDEDEIPVGYTFDLVSETEYETIIWKN